MLQTINCSKQKNYVEPNDFQQRKHIEHWLQYHGAFLAESGVVPTGMCLCAQPAGIRAVLGRQKQAALSSTEGLLDCKALEDRSRDFDIVKSTKMLEQASPGLCSIACGTAKIGFQFFLGTS